MDETGSEYFAMEFCTYCVCLSLGIGSRGGEESASEVADGQLGVRPEGPAISQPESEDDATSHPFVLIVLILLPVNQSHHQVLDRPFFCSGHVELIPSLAITVVIILGLS